MNRLWLAGIGLALGALALPLAGAPQGAVEETTRVFSVAPDEKGAVGLRAVLGAFERASGHVLTMDEETRRLVDHVAFFASGPIECEAEEATRVVGAILASQRFVWHVVRPEAPRVVAIASLETPARATAREHVSYVPAAQLADFAGTNALLIGTAVAPPHTDVGVLANSLRSMVVDPNTLQAMPAGSSGSLVLQGFGPTLFELVSMLRVADRASAGEAPLAAGAHPPALHVARGEFRLPPRRDEISVRPGGPPEGMDLLELVELHARATGQVALVTDGTARLLRETRISPSSPVAVSGDELATFCEELLIENHFAITDLSHGGPCLYQVQSLDTTARAMARQDARYVDAGSVALCARRPATLFQTVITLEHVDVRELVNSMRISIADPNTLQLIPLGDSSSMILQGFGRRLADLVPMLRRIDAAAAGNDGH